MGKYAAFPGFDPGEATTLFEPPGEEEGNWIGAPCVHSHDGTDYLALRERTPEERGRAIVVYRRTGRTDYREVTRLAAEEFDAVSVERPALRTDPATGALKLYVPVDSGANEWSIVKPEDVADPAAFDPETARVVLRPEAGGSDRATVKDPYVLTIGGRYYMFYSGSDGQSEQAHLATSVDGETWRRAASNPILPRQYWHDHHTRVSCVVPAPDAPAWLVFYEGSGVVDHGRTWNLRTGVAVSTDLREFVDTTPDAPRYAAPTGGESGTFETCRYLDAHVTDEGWEFFAEVARADGSFELRWDRLTRESLNQRPN